jgi:hypothetical protein
MDAMNYFMGYHHTLKNVSPFNKSTLLPAHQPLAYFFQSQSQQFAEDFEAAIEEAN